MMWTEEQTALRAGLATCLPTINEGHLERDAAARFPQDAWKILADTGVFGLAVDEQWGGLGQDLLTTMYVLEGLGEGCRDAGLSFSVSTHMVSTGVAVHRFGSPALKAAYLPQVCAGTLIGAHAISEPESGSDALAMRTRATRDRDHFVLNGTKAFVSNGPVADLIVVYARTRPDGGPLGITAFLVPADTPGLERSQPTAKMGLRTSPLCELALTDCRIPADHVVGRVGGGFLVLDHVMQWEILCSFVIKVGEMQHRLDRCLEYARNRRQFGQTIGSFQAVAHKLVDMRIQLETARSWLFATAQRMALGQNVTTDVAIAKLLASEGNLASALTAVQVFGAYGYMTEYGLEKDLRDAVAGTIYSGTSEIQRNRIASMLGL